MTALHHRLGISLGLAHAMLADHRHPGGSAAPALLARACVCLGCGDTPPPWLVALAHSVALRWQRHGPVDTLDSLAKFIAAHLGWDGAGADEDDDLAEPAINALWDNRPPSSAPTCRPKTPGPTG